MKKGYKLFPWTEEHKDFLKKIVYGRSHTQIHTDFMDRFGVDISIGRIKAFLHRYNLTTGFDGRFTPKHVPHNKGIKGWGRDLPNRRVFKKGQMPTSYMSTGTEIIRKGNYIWVKVQHPDKWMSKHRWIWEQVHGPCPEGSVICFLDGDKRNFSIENLECIKRGEMAVLTRKKLRQPDKEITKAGLELVKLILKISQIAKRK